MIFLTIKFFMWQISKLGNTTFMLRVTSKVRAITRYESEVNLKLEI